MIKELDKALELVHEVNKMPFKEFVSKLEEEQGEKFSNEIKEEWKFTGLNNTDFFLTHTK